MARTSSTRERASRRSSQISNASSGPALFMSDESGNEDDMDVDEILAAPAKTRKLIAVTPKPLRGRRSEYKFQEAETVVRKVLEELELDDGLTYNVQFEDRHTEMVAFDQLLSLQEGEEALERFQNQSQPDQSEQSDDEMNLRQKTTRRQRASDFVDITTINFDSDDEGAFDLEDEEDEEEPAARRSGRARTSRGPKRSFRGAETSDEASDSEADTRKRSSRFSRGKRSRPSGGRSTREQRPTRSLPSRSHQSRRPAYVDGDDDDDDEDDDSDELNLLQSDIGPRKRRKVGKTQTQLSARFAKAPREGVRKSDRATRHQNDMQEADVDDIYRSDSDGARPTQKPIVGVREIFQELPRSDEFRNRHIQGCETCGHGSSAGPLIYCQGCILAYHKQCLGHRTNREHLVTKVGRHDFVLQCRRCVNTAKKREQTAPDLAICQACNDTGSSCIPFRERKSPAQEQKEREENDGEDPIANVNPALLNNVHNVLFRCNNCSRGFHFHHLEARSTGHMDIVRDDEEAASERFGEYCRDWLCVHCVDTRKVSSIIAWRPKDIDTYLPGLSAEDMDEDEKQYLLKWEKQSYFRASWMPGPWVWGVTASSMRRAFNRREDAKHPKMRTEDAVPEEFLRIDIVLDVKFTSIVDVQGEEIDKARVKEVDEALIKYKGLGYEDAVWEKVPLPEDEDRWTDFVTAYNDWVLGRYVRIPKQSHLKARLEKLRAQEFRTLEKTTQPENLIGGELMKYQIEGLNWLYYQWYSQKNGILADEMGLGKTIQIIGFMATLVQEHKCFPFLVVVPNSTCANWRREIKRWAPTLRVVTYFGSAAARAMAYQYELFPEKSKELRCHVVVTSYDAAADDNCRKFFKSVNWGGLIVDEGQRLKNDRSQLYAALNTLKTPFKVLLTGTPLQNNTRELFNLLQFLDPSINATALEEEYAEMTQENVSRLHTLIRPFILRRTKAQVLTFLPPMAQIIVPLSMSFLQKELYKNILAKNPDLLKALFATGKGLRPNERASLNNILMQLRKCLCHPFVYSQEIEERTDVQAISHRNLVEASAKLQFLDLLLPKLHERGHRVLIFSQFLDMLDIVEDFLDGLQMQHRRLDGSTGHLEKQKRIDEFNAPNSPLFAFLLSTRAGGVGINLATADTVIILDPDFNPHQDIQALSRAHRIGQKKKVLCFQMMTRASAEEKIVQNGRKKMALDHVVVESLDTEDMEEKDVVSILKHGASELFAENDAENDIKYDAASIEKLLDRTQMENTKSGEDNTAESQFSFARVWENDQGALQDNLNVAEVEEGAMPDPSLWENILKERDRAAAADAAKKSLHLGRGKRMRTTVDYTAQEREAEAEGEAGMPPTPAKPKRRRTKGHGNESDTDFMADDSSEESDVAPDGPIDTRDLAQTDSNKPTKGIAKPFVRSQLPAVPNTSSHLPYPIHSQACQACTRMHPRGACPLKVAGPECCGLCGLAHYGTQRVCPHFASETQVREMLAALRTSTEPAHLVQAAVKYLKGLKGHLVQAKKKKKEKAVGTDQMGGPLGPGGVAIANGMNGGVPGANGGVPMGNGGARAPGDDDSAVASALLRYLGGQ